MAFFYLNRIGTLIAVITYTNCCYWFIMGKMICIAISWQELFSKSFTPWVVLSKHSPNHRGRHLGKMNGHNSTYVKSMAMYFWSNYSGCNGKIMGKVVVMSGWDVYLAYKAVKILATAENSIKDRPTCHRSLFQAYKFAMYFRMSRCDAPTTLVSKGRHCHWDYFKHIIFVQTFEFDW